ncbi:TonB-dependent receptor [Opitutaceae bacterium EW11]|nr:TonB-dependent receptor [Opitutaceae bacterium EW11]
MNPYVSKHGPARRGARTLLTLAGATISAALCAQTATRPATTSDTSSANEEMIVLSPFEVTAQSSTGYVATQTLAGSRINTRLDDVGSAISVVTAEFLKDVGATDNKTLLAYTTNTEVGGAQGNFRGASGGQNQDETGAFTNPNQNTRVRGLTSADNTRNFFISDIPWDGYNVDRVDMQRGANSILFGLGSPAGIINTTTKTAQHRNFSELELRYGSYGANRVALDINQNIIPKQLSLRINLVRNDEEYKQDPAYSLSRRAFGTLRYDPQFLSKNGHKTTVKVNFETGTVRSNNPRTITPTDLITGWWDHLGQAVYNPNTVQNSGQWYDANGTAYWKDNTGEYNSTRTPGGAANPYYQPWLGAPQMYGGVWMQYNPGDVGPYTATMPEYKNIGGISSKGATDGGIGGLPFSRRVTVASTAYWAERMPSAPYQKWGLWKSQTLSDPSVFDFYNNLIDGENKNEWQNFKNLSATLTQTFFNDLVGFEAAYDKQRYRSGQYSFNGSGALYVDINSYNLDGTPNANVGKPYIESNYTYGNSSYDSSRESARLSAFLDYNFNRSDNGGWFKKLLGRHTVSGLLSQDSWRTDRRSFKRYGTPDSFGALVATGTNASYIDSNDRAVTSTIYLGDSLASAKTYRGVDIPRAGGEVVVPSTVQWRYFDSTWNAPSVDPAAPWVSTYNGQTLTQSENPANYVGWKTTAVNLLSAEAGDQDALTYSASLNKRVVDSYAGVWQAHFWDGAVVGMYGIRHDKVKSWAFEGIRVNNRVNFTALDSEGRLHYSTDGKEATLYEANSPSWSVVAKLNRFIGNRLPVNVNLYYNRSQNFQVVGTRNNIYGEALPAPSGKTKDIGIMISDKEERFWLRINKYKTTVNNATNSTGIPTWYLLGGGNFIQRQEDRADAYEYHLAELGNPASANGTGSWTWRYAPRAGETQEQADAVAAAAVAGWRAYTNEPIVKRILAAWGFNDFSKTQLTTMSHPVANFVATEDQVSKGWEYEFTANPTRNWRITFNASDTKALRTNIGGSELQEFIELTNKYHNGPMGDLRQWGGGGTASTALVSWNSNFYSKYLLMKLQEGSYSSELRQWRYNLVTNYSFTRGVLKGVNVGAGYRWQDKIAIGYPVKADGTGNITFDLDNPYYGPSEDAIDFWVGYQRKLTSRIDWRIQLNVRNVGEGNKLVPLTAQYDGAVAAWGIAPSQTWTITNTFKF